jgi:hypothetical protein
MLDQENDNSFPTSKLDEEEAADVLDSLTRCLCKNALLSTVPLGSNLFTISNYGCLNFRRSKSPFCKACMEAQPAIEK